MNATTDTPSIESPAQAASRTRPKFGLLKALTNAHANLVNARKIAAIEKHECYEDVGDALDCVEAALVWVSNDKVSQPPASPQRQIRLLFPMNDTPRTNDAWDAALEEVSADGLWSDAARQLRDHARELELELAQAVEQRRSLREENTHLRKRVAEIANDYIPSSEIENGLALQEMRDALKSLVSA